MILSGCTVFASEFLPNVRIGSIHVGFKGKPVKHKSGNAV